MSTNPSGRRRITQATFDSVVEENVRDFGLGPAEALTDAITQFQAAGVDLSNIITDGSAASHPVLMALKELKAHFTGAAAGDAAAPARPLVEVLTALAAACANSPANKEIAGANEGMDLVRAAVKKSHGATPGTVASPADMRAAVDALRNLCVGCDPNRMAFPEHELEGIVDGMNATQPADLQRSCMLAAAVLCVKREPIKTSLYDRGVPDIIMHNLTEPASEDAGVVKDTCTFLSKLLTDDDYSVFSSKAYEFARNFASAGIAPKLLAVLQKHNHTLATAAEIFSAIRSICVNDEICREIEGLDGVAIITSALAEYVARGDDGGSGPSGPEEVVSTPASEAPTPLAAEVAAASGTPAAAPAASSDNARRTRMVRNGFAVLRSLGHSDPIKIRMCEGEAAPLGLMLQALQTFAGSPSVLEQAIAAIGILCLRLGQNAAIVHERDGLGLIANSMKRHPAHAGMQRAACLAIRNIVVRSPPRVAAAFDQGLEALLQQSYMRHPFSRDVAYACLRDMGCSYAETDIGKAQAERVARAMQTGDIRTQ